MVGSRHSSLRLPSTTVRATLARPWSWAGVTSPAGQPSSQASTSEVTRSGTDQGRSTGAVDRLGAPSPRSLTLPARGPAAAGAGTRAGWFAISAWAPRRVGPDMGPASAGAGTRAGWFATLASWFATLASAARRMVSSTNSASDHAGAAWRPVMSTERMRTSFAVDPGASAAVRQRVDAGRRRAREPARAGGSPQREGGAGRRARGHAQDPFSLGWRRGWRPRAAFRCGMAPGGCRHRRRLSSRGVHGPPLSD
jgi:hypothetical protein